MTQPYQTQPPPQAPPQPEPKKSWKRKLGWLPLTVVLGVASCGVIINAIGGEDEDPTTASAPPSAATETTNAPLPVEETTTEPEPTPESDCKPLKKSQLSEIAPGMEHSARVKSGVWVPLTDEYQFGFNQVIALQLRTGDVATFAAESLGKSSQGLLMAVNGPARKHFTWGAAVNPGSPMDDDLQAVKDSPEYAEAVGCARGEA